MDRRATLAAVCLSGFALAGCGAHLASEGTLPTSDDASRSGRAAFSELATTGQTSATQPASGPINIPRDFPVNYRVVLAAALAGEYFSEGRGTPEISDFQPSPAPRAINQLCVQYPGP